MNYEPNNAGTISQQNEETERLKAQITSLREVVKEMEDELATKSQDLDNTLEINKVNKDTLTKLKTEHSEKINEIQSLQIEKSNLQDQIETLNNQLAEQDEQVRQLDQEKAVHECTVTMLEKDLSQVKVVVKEKEEQIEKLLLEGEKRNEDIVELYKQLQSLQEEKAQELTSVRENKEKDMAALSKQLEQSLTENKNEIDRLAAEREKLSQSATIHIQKVHELEGRLLEKERSFDNQNKELQVMKQEVERLAKELDTAQSKVRALEEVKEKEHVQREQLQGEINRLSESTNAFSADSAKYCEKVVAFRTAVDDNTN